MAEAGGEPSGRGALRRRYLLLRDPHGGAFGPGLTERSGRFAARQRGCRLTLPQLSALPMWELNPHLDRERLAAAAGLLASRPALARAIDGGRLQALASSFGEALLERMLDDAPPADEAASNEALDLPLDPAALRAAGRRLMEQAAVPANVAARRICERAGGLIAELDLAAAERVPA